MNLYPNWLTILRKAWSVRFMLMAAFFTGIETALPILQPILEPATIPTGLFAALSGLATSAALVSRIVAQRDV